MRFFAISICSSFFILVIGSPVDYGSNNLDLNDDAINSGYQPETQPTQPDSSISIALNNEDPTLGIDSDVLNASPDSQPDLSYIAYDQEKSTHVNGKKKFTQPNSNSLAVQKSHVENCKQKSKGKSNQPCAFPGIDWTSTILTSLLAFFGLGFLGFVTWVIGQIVKESKMIPKVDDVPEGVTDEEREFWDVIEELIQSDKKRRGQTEQEIGEEQTEDGDDAKADQFKKAVKDVDQPWLHHTIEDGLIKLGYGVGAAAAATYIVGGMETIGFAFALI